MKLLFTTAIPARWQLNDEGVRGSIVPEDRNPPVREAHAHTQFVLRVEAGDADKVRAGVIMLFVFAQSFAISSIESCCVGKLYHSPAGTALVLQPHRTCCAGTRPASD